MNTTETRGVWVFIEQRHGDLQKVSLELLGKGRELADKLGQELVGVLLGHQVADLAPTLVAHGADRVLVAEHECLETFVNEPYAKAFAALIEERKPEIVMIGATALGRDLAPRVSARVKTGLTADCTSLDIDEETKNLLMTRPAFGGNLLATIICPEHRPQMSTVRPGVMQKLVQDDSRQGTIETIVPALSSSDVNVEILEEVRTVEKKISIEEASVLVSGGRGLGKRENFQLVERLAEELGGEVSASRAIVDAGWIDRERQVGQTGKTVRPSLYVACGISGAIQHIAGMEGSDFIVAINKNNDAPIFEVSDVGIVGDVTKVLPAIIEELRSERN
ncbi:MAG: electron transfer flavoprotein subunit alpha/FixB family protein [Bacteroidota bacterium]